MKYLKHVSILLTVFFALTSCGQHESEKLVILHTNDTHSQIDPTLEDRGGAVRRKALIDSVRAAEKNVLVVDAGDAVQGTLYFYLYGGEVEQKVMNALGVDMRILGNHEFDNGLDSLAQMLAISKAEKLASNYELSGTPLEGMFAEYSVRSYGNKKIGFIGLGLDPKGIVLPENFEGLVFKPIVATADSIAGMLKKEHGVEAVVALTHIGFNPAYLIGDSILATYTRNIDVIIGGHSHDLIDPDTDKGARRSRLINADGKPVLVAQSGKSGQNVGKITIDLDSIALGVTPDYEILPVDGRYDAYADTALINMLEQYSRGVDSLMNVRVGSTLRMMDRSDPELLNFFSDRALERGREMAPRVDFAIVNRGGLRTSLPEGDFSKGHILNMFPFKNFLWVIDIKGADLKDVFDVMAATGGNGVSANVSANYVRDADGAHAENILINGRPLDPNRTYRVATIDYLVKGGDYMTGLTRSAVVKKSPRPLYDDFLIYFTEGEGRTQPLQSDPQPRWAPLNTSN